MPPTSPLILKHMNFAEVCTRSELPPEAVRYYVESKLLAPLYPRRNSPEEGEYAESDVVLLKAIGNMRRLGLSIDDVRLILLDHTKLEEVKLQNIDLLKQRRANTNSRLQQLQDVGGEYFLSIDALIQYFSNLPVDSSLPQRDIDLDEGHKIRFQMQERQRENEELLTEINAHRSREKRLRATLIITGILLLLALGWIIAPIWMLYLPKP